jgi:transposase
MFFLGVDYSKRFSVLTLINGKGVVVLKTKAANKRCVFEECLKPYRKIKAVVEAGRNWEVAVDLLDGLAETILAHPVKVRAIAEAKIKTDDIDSETLAQLLRANLIPQAYLRTRSLREKQAILRLRSFWIRKRTSVRNRIHVLIDGQAEDIREQSRDWTDLFGKRGKEWLQQLQLPEVFNSALKNLIDLEMFLTEKIKQSDRHVKEIYQASEQCKLIRTIPGFGVFLSVLAFVEIGTIQRFRSAAHLCSYAGVIPSTYSSGGKTRHGKIIKGGNKAFRWCLVEAAIHSGLESPELKKFYFRMKRRKGTKVARIALARKLCMILFRVLSQNDSYHSHFKKRSRLHFVSSVPL